MRRFHTRWRVVIAVVATVASASLIACTRAGLRRTRRPVERRHADRTVRGADRHDHQLPARDRRGDGHRPRPERHRADELPRRAGRGHHHRHGRRVGRTPPTWWATTATETSRCFSCAARAACRRRRIGDSSQLAVGDPVVALGNASGSGSPLTREAGQVVGFGRTINAKDELTGASNQATGLDRVRRAGSRRRLGRSGRQRAPDRSSASRRPPRSTSGWVRAAPASPSRSTTRWRPQGRSVRGRRPTPCTSARPRCSASASTARTSRTRCPASSSSRCCRAALLSRPASHDGDVLAQHQRRAAQLGDRAHRRAGPALPR